MIFSARSFETAPPPHLLSLVTSHFPHPASSLLVSESRDVSVPSTLATAAFRRRFSRCLIYAMTSYRAALPLDLATMYYCSSYPLWYHLLTHLPREKLIHGLHHTERPALNFIIKLSRDLLRPEDTCYIVHRPRATILHISTKLALQSPPLLATLLST